MTCVYYYCISVVVRLCIHINIIGWVHINITVFGFFLLLRRIVRKLAVDLKKNKINKFKAILKDKGKISVVLEYI